MAAVRCQWAGRWCRGGAYWPGAVVSPRVNPVDIALRDRPSGRRGRAEPVARVGRRGAGAGVRGCRRRAPRLPGRLQPGPTRRRPGPKASSATGPPAGIQVRQCRTGRGDIPARGPSAVKAYTRSTTHRGLMPSAQSRSNAQWGVGSSDTQRDQKAARSRTLYLGRSSGRAATCEAAGEITSDGERSPGRKGPTGEFVFAVTANSGRLSVVD